MDPLIFDSETNFDIDSPMALNHLHSNWGTVMHMIFNFNLENTCDSDTTKPKKDDSNSATITYHKRW